MGISAVVNSKGPAFWAVAHSAVVNGLGQAWSRCSRARRKPHEPDLVAGLVLDSTPLLWQGWRALLEPHGLSISICGVFCHQSPRVRYEGIAKSYTELGDLLIVHTHYRENGEFEGNALLYQAKMSSQQPYRVPATELHQLKLYLGWPQFEYINSPPLSSQLREVKPRASHAGAQYLLIDDREPDSPLSGLTGAPGTYPAASCMPDYVLFEHNDLGSELVGLLRGTTGRRFSDLSEAQGSRGWSMIVWDLIQVSQRKFFRRKRSGLIDKARMVQSGDLDGMFYARRSAFAELHTLGRAAADRSQVAELFRLSRDPTPSIDPILDRLQDFITRDSRSRASIGFPPDPPDSPRSSDRDEGQPGISLILIETAEGDFNRQ